MLSWDTDADLSLSALTFGLGINKRTLRTLWALGCAMGTRVGTHGSVPSRASSET